jgi:hypothetical protein
VTSIPFRITDTFLVQEVVGKQRGGRSCVRLQAPLMYCVGHEDSEERITVPAGFETDFASIPWGLWNLFPPWGAYARPAIVHDYLYEVGGQIPGRCYTRKQADGIFREAMGVVGVPAWRAAIMYRAVRLGGGSGWGSR